MPRLNYGTLLENIVVLKLTRIGLERSRADVPIDFASSFAMPSLTDCWCKSAEEANNPCFNHAFMQSLSIRDQQSPVLQSALCWSTIIFEIAFVSALFLPPPLLVALLVIGMMFHAPIAVVMGLNGFFWAFVSTYPSAIFLNEAIRARF